MDYIESLKQRYSVKKFDKRKKIPQESLNRILEAGKLSASSLGLQPYEIYIVGSDQLLDKLIPAFHNPSQISTCSHLIIIIAKTAIGEEYIDNYFKHIAATRDLQVENLTPFRNSIGHHLNDLERDEITNWAERQGYIVLGNLLFAAALENIDSCPMEGFSGEKIAELLNIDKEKEKVSVTLALGYRAWDDPFQNNKKVRKPDDKIFKIL